MKERHDAELYYLSCIVNQGPMPDDQRNQEYPRWQDLCLSKLRTPPLIVL